MRADLVQHGRQKENDESYVPERFAIPYSFKPQLTVGEAVIGAAGAILRVFSGSLLFSFWGTYTLMACYLLSGRFRAWAIMGLAILFVASLTVTMLAISALIKAALFQTWQRRAGPSLRRRRIRGSFFYPFFTFRA